MTVGTNVPTRTMLTTLDFGMVASPGSQRYADAWERITLKDMYVGSSIGLKTHAQIAAHFPTGFEPASMPSG